MLKGFTRNFKPLEILTDEQVERIHRASLNVLWKTGIRYEHEKALKLFELNGCKVDHDEMRVRIPSGLVEECLRKCPSNFYMKARDPKNDLMIGGKTLYFNACPGKTIIDLDTWETRPPTLSDCGDAARVLDALDSLHFVFTGGYTTAGDVPPIMGMLEAFATTIRNTSKCVAILYYADYELFAIKMAKAVGIDLMGVVSASPPLTYYNDAVESAFRLVEADFPVGISSGQVMGGTGPVTQAGSTVANNAEIIAGIVLVQLLRPGTRVLADNYTFPMDMGTGNPAYGSLGQAMHQVLFSQIWRNYKIPTKHVSAGIVNSKKIDFQNAYERTFSVVTAALAGTHMIQLHGGGHAQTSYHPVQSILDDDIAEMAGHFVEGIEVNDETLAMNLIDEVGPIPGYYLSKEHTRKWWKKEGFVPKVADRSSYGEWVKIGKKDALAYAKDKMEKLLATSKPPPLTSRQEEDVERILEEARRYYRGKGMM